MEISIHPIQEIEPSVGNNGSGEDLLGGTANRSVDRAWLLWDNRRLLWRSMLCGLVLATLFAFLLRKSYTSTARLMPPEKESGSSPLALMAAMSGSGVWRFRFQSGKRR